MDRWRGRVAVVTGASSGIGEGIVKELVKHGLTVVGIARRVDRIQALAKGLTGEKGSLFALKADIRNEKEVLEAFAWVDKNTSGIDVLVNNAGFLVQENLLDGSTEGWKNILELNVVGVALCAREAIKSMKKKGAEDGIVINVSSILGHNVLTPKLTMYTSSKFAVTALSEGIQQELAASASRIRVTNLCPGLVKTDMVKDFSTPKPSGTTILEPVDIAQAVIFILSVDKRVHIPELTLQQNFPFVL